MIRTSDKLQRRAGHDAALLHRRGGRNGGATQAMRIMVFSITCLSTLTSPKLIMADDIARLPISDAERAALRHLQAKHRGVSLATQFRNKRLRLDGKMANDDWRQLSKLKSLKTLWLYSKNVSDCDLARLKGLNQLDAIDL